MEKACTKCKKTHPIEFYYSNVRAKQKIRSECKDCVLEYQRKTKDRHNALQRKRYKDVILNNPLLKLKGTLRSRTFVAIKKIETSKRVSDFLFGVDMLIVKKHLESQFKDGMTWDNHGRNGWHIDHIIPLASANTEIELLRLCQFDNLQPLWAKDNISKGDSFLDLPTLSISALQNESKKTNINSIIRKKIDSEIDSRLKKIS